MSEPRGEYERRLALRRAEVARGETLDLRLSATRGVTALAGIVTLWLALARGAIASEWILVPVAVFVALAWSHERVLRARRRAERAPAAPAEICARQEAVDELRERLELREGLALLGAKVTTGVEPSFLVEWAEAPSAVFPRWAPSAGAALSALTTAALVHWQGFGGAPDFFLAAAVAQSLFAVALRRKADEVLRGFDRATRNLGLLAEILVRIEREPIAAARLVALRQSLETDGLPPSRRIATLAGRADLLDSRKNQFFAPFAALFLWSSRAARSGSSPRTISRWRRSRTSSRRAPRTRTSRTASRTARWCSTTGCAPASSPRATRSR